MTKSDKKGLYSILLLLFIIIMMGIAGRYDYQCAKEDQQVRNEMNFDASKISLYEDTIYTR